MSETLPLPTGWKSVAHPPSLFCRYEFAGYAQTRAFLDALMLVSEETGIFPDLGFGKTYVNVTVRGQDGGGPGQADTDFAARVACLATAELP